MTAVLDHYHALMQRAPDHIDRHLDGNLDLNAVKSPPRQAKRSPAQNRFVFISFECSVGGTIMLYSD